MLCFFLFYLHEFGESGHSQNLVNFGRHVGDFELTLELSNNAHSLLDNTQTRTGHVGEFCAVHFEVNTSLLKGGLDVLLELVGVHSVDS